MTSVFIENSFFQSLNYLVSLFYNILCRRFRDARGLQYVLSDQLDGLMTSYDALVPEINTLDTPPTPALIVATVECCLRPTVQQIRK